MIYYLLFYFQLKVSELQDNDWIRLYLELAAATTNMNNGRDKHSLTNLKILKVAMESTQGLGNYDAFFYIRCRCKDQMDVLIQTQVQQRMEQSLQQRSVRADEQVKMKIATWRMDCGSRLSWYEDILGNKLEEIHLGEGRSHDGSFLKGLREVLGNLPYLGR